MEIVLLQSAQADLLEIFSRHGEASYHTIDRSLERIRLMPEIAPIYHGQFHRKIPLSGSSGRLDLMGIVRLAKCRCT